ncbi:MAG: tetratricopeptide repeat protein [Pyrinomonadaceae bacterium]
MKFRKTISYLVLLLVLWSATALAPAQITQTDSRGRRWSQLIEPPPPDPNWDKLREQQLTFAQRLNELGVTAEYKVTGGEDAGGLVELLPEGMQISGSYLGDDRFKFELGTALPKLPGAEQPAMAKLSLEFKTDTPTVSEIGFEGPVSPSTKITSTIRYDQIHDPNWSVGVELQQLFARFKGEIANGAVNRTVEISLVNVFNSARGLATPSDLPRDLIIKVDTVKFYNAVVNAVKQEIASTPNLGSKVVRGMFIRFNPVLMVAALRNDRSMLAVQRAAVLVQQAMASRFPKGVKIQYNELLLGEMLRRAKGAPSLASIAGDLEDSKSSAAQAKITKFIDDLTSAYRSTLPRQSPSELVTVSLRQLVTEADHFRDKWSTLPERLSKPGLIGRIIGYRIDPANDIYLIGVPSAPASALSIDEIVNGITASYINNDSPFCSLDPDPSNIGGVQSVRVGGVPVNSQFARTMLDADYLMKKINAGVVKADVAGYKSIDTILLEQSDRYDHVDVMSRFWFYPLPLHPGSIELSSDGQSVFFANGMQVLSEQMVRARDGLVGIGTSDAIANQLADGFTRALPELETKFADISRLHGLFDVVLMGKIWRQMDVRSQWIDRLVGLPAVTLAEKTYDGVNARVYTGSTSQFDLYVTGGVRLRTSAGSRAMLVVDDLSQKINDASSQPNSSLTTRVDFKGSIPSSAGAMRSNIDGAAITGMIARGQFDRATVEIQKLLVNDPYEPEVWCLKAENDLQRTRFVSAIDNAERALELAPEDPENQVRASIDLFTAHFMLGENQEALDAVKNAARSVPDSLQLRLFNADALAATGKFEEARKEFRLIQRGFPSSSEAYLRFGLFEISEGNILTGKRDFIDRALKLSKTDPDTAAAESALSLAEVGIAIFEDPESHLRNAESLANKVLADKASGPLSRLRALTAKSIVALAMDNISEADAIADEVLRITPANPTILLTIAEWAHNSKRPETALQYLARAEKIAPNMPLVKAVGSKIRGQQ